jgi:hypothetical protein
VNQNIRGGITYLKQMYQKYGNWQNALAAYNWGPRKVDTALATPGASIPGQVLNYVKGILGIGAVYNGAMNQIASKTPDSSGAAVSGADLLANLLPATGGTNKVVLAVAVIGGVGALAWWLAD